MCQSVIQYIYMRERACVESSVTEIHRDESSGDLRGEKRIRVCSKKEKMRKIERESERRR